MIVEQGSLALHGYAVLLIADYHLEYPLTKPKKTAGYTRVELAWHSFTLEGLFQELNKDRLIDGGNQWEVLKRNFLGDIERKYNGFFDHDMNLWLVQGSLDDLHRIFADHRNALNGGPQGADDDTFDYWPNAFEMLVVMADDLAELTGKREYYNAQVQSVIDSIPPEKMEYEEYQELRKTTILKEEA